MSTEVGHDLDKVADTDKQLDNAVTGPEDTDLTQGETPAQKAADDETSAPEQEGSDTPKSTK